MYFHFVMWADQNNLYVERKYVGFVMFMFGYYFHVCVWMNVQTDIDNDDLWIILSLFFSFPIILQWK